MSINHKYIINFSYIKSIVFYFLIFILPVNSETKIIEIIAKKGDTILKLSKEYGVPLKELMHKNKFNDASQIIEDQLIIIPLRNTPKDKSNHLIYKVIEGDTLYKIARIHNINLKDIISINKLNKESILQPNQIILIPEGAIYKNETIKKDIKLANKKVFYHQTSKNENLLDIVNLHNIKKEEIIALNKLNQPISIMPNTKLKIREIESIKWLKYGSLIINWSDWTFLDNSYITRAKNKNNKPFYIALNCEKRILNNTLKNSHWTSWYFPEKDFEFKLIKDFCDKN